MENREHFLIKAHPHHKHSQRTYEPVVATVSSHFLVAIEMLMSLRTVRPPKRRKGFTFSARNRTFEPCNGANEYSIFVVPAVSIGLKKHICIFIHTPLFLSHSLGIKFAMIFAIAQHVNSSCSWQRPTVSDESWCSCIFFFISFFFVSLPRQLA